MESSPERAPSAEARGEAPRTRPFRTLRAATAVAASHTSTRKKASDEPSEAGPPDRGQHQPAGEPAMLAQSTCQRC